MEWSNLLKNNYNHTDFILEVQGCFLTLEKSINITHILTFWAR